VAVVAEPELAFEQKFAADPMLLRLKTVAAVVVEFAVVSVDFVSVDLNFAVVVVAERNRAEAMVAVVETAVPMQIELVSVAAAVVDFDFVVVAEVDFDFVVAAEVDFDFVVAAELALDLDFALISVFVAVEVSAAVDFAADDHLLNLVQFLPCFCFLSQIKIVKLVAICFCYLNFTRIEMIAF
jgi:hypothetical protein